MNIDVSGYESIINLGSCCSIFLAPESIDDLELRLINRGGLSREKITERIKQAKYEINQQNKYDYVIINSHLTKTYKVFEQIILEATHEKRK